MRESRRPDARLLLAILDELPIGVWAARAPNGELTYANRLFAEVLGIGARDDVQVGEYVPAYGIQDRYGKPYPEGRLPFVRALRERRTVVVDDLVIARSDGGQRHVRALGKPLFDAAGEISDVMVAFVDISEEVAMEVQRAAVQEKLRAAVHHAPILLFTTDREGNVTLSEGAALASLGFTSGELVGRNAFELYPDHPQVQENLRRALAGETFTNVVDLGDTVLENWQAPLRDARGEVEGIIGVCTDITERLRMQRQMAHADRMSGLGRLAASVAHEINNPLAFAMESIRLALEAAATNCANRLGGDVSEELRHLRRLLEDAADGRERIFDPFFTTKSAGEGTGLGLYVTRNLISALSGTITVGRARQGGALFRLTLPVAREDECGGAMTSAPPRNDERPRVMIVDDEPALARVLRMSIEDECEVRTFESGRAALEELLSGAEYDVIFCDLMMADLGGLELYEQLRAQAPGRERNLVFMTGGVFDPDVASHLASIPNRCVEKPFDIRVEVWKHAGVGR